MLRIVGVILLAFVWMPQSFLGNPSPFARGMDVSGPLAEIDPVAYSLLDENVAFVGDLPRPAGLCHRGAKNLDLQSDGRSLSRRIAPAVCFHPFVLYCFEKFTPSKPWQFLGQRALHPRAPCWLV